LFGTTIEVRICARTRRGAERTDKRLAGELERLQKIFNVFDPDSELRRYRLDPTLADPELFAVIELAGQWRATTHNAFHPGIDAIRYLWESAAANLKIPSDDDLKAAAERLEADLDDDEIRRHLNLNAIAKGWSIDRAIESVMARHLRPRSIVVNAGGDIAHRGDDTTTVGIEDPKRPYNNVKPTLSIVVGNSAVEHYGSPNDCSDALRECALFARADRNVAGRD
jgi:thiamine biosynthesis lipoprotein